MNFINNDIDKLVPNARLTSKMKEHESKLFQVDIEHSGLFLAKEAQIVWTIKDMGLDPKSFFIDPSNNLN